MASIITDISGDLQILMNSSRWARQSVVQSNWNKLRIALHMIFVDTGANITGTPRLGVGVCSGNTNILGDATTTNWVGAISNEATWARSGGNLFYADVNWSAATRVGTTLTTSASPIFTTSDMPFGSRLACMFVDITKGSPNFSVNAFLPNGITSGINIPDATFVEQSNAEVSVVTLHGFGAAQNIAVDEGTNGTLNHVNVWWSNASGFRIARVRVIRFS